MAGQSRKKVIAAIAVINNMYINDFFLVSFDRKRTIKGIKAMRKIAGSFVRIERPNRIPAIIRSSALGFFKNTIRDNRHRSMNEVRIASRWISLE